MKKALLLLSLLLAACQPDDTKINGYVEGEYLYLAPTTPGLLQKLSVERGQNVAAGAPLFAIDTTNLEASLASAEAEAAKAKAAQQADSNDLRRILILIPSGAASQADLDAKRAAVEADAAALRMAEQKSVQIKKQIIEAAPKAPTAGRIEDTYYRVGEYIGAGTAVVSFLPPENVKIRFFVPQADIPKFTPGTPLLLRCDGCAAQIKAKVSFVATQSEYTPPVIYSIGSRDKLVFMIEAKPDIYDASLRPGLPVDIERPTP